MKPVPPMGLVAQLKGHFPLSFIMESIRKEAKRKAEIALLQELEHKVGEKNDRKQRKKNTTMRLDALSPPAAISLKSQSSFRVSSPTSPGLKSPLPKSLDPQKASLPAGDGKIRRNLKKVKEASEAKNLESIEVANSIIDVLMDKFEVLLHLQSALEGVPHYTGNSITSNLKESLRQYFSQPDCRFNEVENEPKQRKSNPGKFKLSGISTLDRESPIATAIKHTEDGLKTGYFQQSSTGRDRIVTLGDGLMLVENFEREHVQKRPSHFRENQIISVNKMTCSSLKEESHSINVSSSNDFEPASCVPQYDPNEPKPAANDQFQGLKDRVFKKKKEMSPKFNPEWMLPKNYVKQKTANYMNKQTTRSFKNRLIPRQSAMEEDQLGTARRLRTSNVEAFSVGRISGSSPMKQQETARSKKGRASTMSLHSAGKGSQKSKKANEANQKTALMKRRTFLKKSSKRLKKFYDPVPLEEEYPGIDSFHVHDPSTPEEEPVPEQIEKFIRLKRIQIDINEFKQREKQRALLKKTRSKLNKDLMKELDQEHPMNLSQIENLDTSILAQLEASKQLSSDMNTSEPDPTAQLQGVIFDSSGNILTFPKGSQELEKLQNTRHARILQEPNVDIDLEGPPVEVFHTNPRDLKVVERPKAEESSSDSHSIKEEEDDYSQTTKNQNDFRFQTDNTQQSRTLFTTSQSRVDTRSSMKSGLVKMMKKDECPTFNGRNVLQWLQHDSHFQHAIKEVLHEEKKLPGQTKNQPPPKPTIAMKNISKVVYDASGIGQLSSLLPKNDYVTLSYDKNPLSEYSRNDSNMTQSRNYRTHKEHVVIKGPSLERKNHRSIEHNQSINKQLLLSRFTQQESKDLEDKLMNLEAMITPPIEAKSDFHSVLSSTKISKPKSKDRIIISPKPANQSHLRTSSFGKASEDLRASFAHAKTKETQPRVVLQEKKLFDFSKDLEGITDLPISPQDKPLQRKKQSPLSHTQSRLVSLENTLSPQPVMSSTIASPTSDPPDQERRIEVLNNLVDTSRLREVLESQKQKKNYATQQNSPILKHKDPSHMVTMSMDFDKAKLLTHINSPQDSTQVSRNMSHATRQLARNATLLEKARVKRALRQTSTLEQKLPHRRIFSREQSRGHVVNYTQFFPSDQRSSEGGTTPIETHHSMYSNLKQQQQPRVPKDKKQASRFKKALDDLSNSQGMKPSVYSKQFLEFQSKIQDYQSQVENSNQKNLDSIIGKGQDASERMKHMELKKYFDKMNSTGDTVLSMPAMVMPSSSEINRKKKERSVFDMRKQMMMSTTDLTEINYK